MWTVNVSGPATEPSAAPLVIIKGGQPETVSKGLRSVRQVNVELALSKPILTNFLLQ